uniref:Protein aurora borealis n=1 Tax=Caenorhabditis tropicalis TaxID=1561998 RepID=A0A1I7SYE0_9PELO
MNDMQKSFMTKSQAIWAMGLDEINSREVGGLEMMDDLLGPPCFAFDCGEETANDGSDLPLNSLDVPIRDVDKDSHEEKKQLLNNEQRIVFDTVISAVHDEKLIL